jgi:hypothetical protein
MPMTSWRNAVSRWISRVPIAPDAPASRTLMTVTLRGLVLAGSGAGPVPPIRIRK